MPIVWNCQGTKRSRGNPGYCFPYSFIDSSTRSNARIMSAFALLPLISPRFKASKDAIISLYCLFASCSNLSHFILSPLYFNIIRPPKKGNRTPERCTVCTFPLFDFFNCFSFPFVFALGYARIIKSNDISILF